MADWKCPISINQEDVFPLLRDSTLSWGNAISSLPVLGILPCNSTNQFVWKPYLDSILRDNPLALQEKQTVASCC